MRTWFIAFILISLLAVQLIYSFSFPAVASNDNWQPISTYLPKFDVGDSDNFLLEKVYPLISSDYRLNSDVGHFLELGRNFSPQYFEGHSFLDRPLYPFLIFLPSVFTNFFTPTSYGITFGSAILVNFILISLTVLLFFSLLQKLFSSKVAWLSSVLLIFSPFVHSYLTQPLAEMLMAFAVVAAACLLYEYAKRPSILKLIVFSLIIGVFMLGKMFFAISLFILILAVYFKRYKEGMIFLLVHLMPFLFWYLWITQVWQIGWYSLDVEHWRMGVWVFDMLRWPWYETAKVLLAAVPNFIVALIYSFILIPVFFSVIGFQQMPFKSKNIIYFGSLFSILVLCFLMGLYFHRHTFLLFPVIYPTAILGIERVSSYLKKYKSWYSLVFYVIVIGLILIISNVNIYQIFNYNGYL